MIIRLYIAFCLAIISLPLSAQTFTNYTTAEGLAHNTVNCLEVDSDDNIWFGTDAGISFFDEENNTWLTLDMAQGTGLVDDRILAIHMSPFSGLWVGTDFGISNWDGTSFTSYTEADGIGDNRIQWIEEGENGVLYFANKEGFTIYDGEEWQVFGMAEGIPFGGVKSLSVVDGDIVVLGLGLEGVALFDHVDATLNVFNVAEGLLSNKVKSVLFYENENGADVEDEVWVASDNGMNRIYSDENGELVIESHPSVFELPPPHEVNQLTDVKIDSKGIVWAGVWIEYLSDVGGISFYDGSEWMSLDVDDGLVGPVVYQLAIDSKDCVWVATSTGVSKYCSPLSFNIEVEKDRPSLYPNPTHDNIIVDFKNAGNDEEGVVSILNAEMKTLSTISVIKGSDKIFIELSALPSGVYFLRIGNDLEKFVKL